MIPWTLLPLGAEIFFFFLMSGTGADLDMLATDLIDTSAGYYTYPVYFFRNILNFAILGSWLLSTIWTPLPPTTPTRFGFRI